jgi:hypothetical protein
VHPGGGGVCLFAAKITTKAPGHEGDIEFSLWLDVFAVEIPLGSGGWFCLIGRAK